MLEPFASSFLFSSSLLWYNCPMFTGFVVTLLHCVWGLPQMLLGLVLFLWEKTPETRIYRNAVVTVWDRKGSLSLGQFIFLEQDSPDFIVKHEYGHTIQSLILGPFYLPVIGIPSFLWANIRILGRKWRSRRKSYFDFYTEKWANRLGGVVKTDDGRFV